MALIVFKCRKLSLSALIFLVVMPLKVAISNQDVSHLLTDCTWSGSREQAARKLEFTIIQDDRDPLIPIVDVDNGMTCYAGDDEGNVVFVGNIYNLERDRKNSHVKIVAFDNLFVLNKSKTTRKFSESLPEDITKQICSEMGILAGDIVSTGEKVSFIANGKTGYQIIMAAYTEASKKNQKKYQCLMNRNRLDVIEKGTLLDFELDSARNMTESIYKESIENLVNRVLVVDDAGNGGEIISDDESIAKYSMFQAIYRQAKDKDTATEVKALFKKPEREGQITALGDYSVISGYSVTIRDALFAGQFWVKSDVHTFRGGVHEMKLSLEFENLMSEEKADVAKK